MTVSSYRFKAFISYSHRDQTVAKWLHGALESYRVPQRLVGKETGTGTIARRIGPVFRDRDELPVASDLSGKINEALASTQFLIVLCSPASAQSKWVNQEVINFKRLKGEDSIIAVILGGEPFASGMPGREAEECFVPALRFRVDADGALTNQTAEPIAADLRPDKDSKRLVKLKVIAGLLGLGLDELVRRENQRRTQRLFWLATGMAAAMVVMGVLTVFAIQSRNDAVIARDDAERQKTQAEDLIEFMLGDLRKKLEPVGRLDVLDSVGDRALKYFATLRPNEIDEGTLGRRSRALHLIGEIHVQRGGYTMAREVFAEALTTTRELTERFPGDSQRLFEHTQSIYWLGYVDWQTGDFSAAERAFDEYLRLTGSLADIEPQNPNWRKEIGYAYVNVGVLQLASQKFSAASEKFQRAVGIFRALYGAEPEDEAIARDFAQSLSWYSASLRAEGLVRQALTVSDAERDIYTEMLKKDGNDHATREVLVGCNIARGRLLLDLGEISSSLDVLRDATTQASQLSRRDPDNMGWAEMEARALLELTEAQALAELWPQAMETQQKSESVAQRLINTTANEGAWKSDLLTPLLIVKANILLRIGNDAQALESLDEAQTILATSVAEQSGSRLSREWLGSAIAMARGDASVVRGDKHRAAAFWEQAMAALGPEEKAENFDERILRAGLLHRLHSSNEGVEHEIFISAEARRPLLLINTHP